MTSFLDRIDQVNPEVNAIVSLRDRDELMAEAAAADETEPAGPFHGLPFAVKDLSNVIGLPTSYGSVLGPTDPLPIDSIFVSRLRAAGVIFIGKTNTPEFGAGSHTFNEVFGVTRNPHNLALSAGGSSGGASAATATGMLPFADGSDLGGSLRNPAAWCGVVGFRPSLGSIAAGPVSSAFINDLATNGPIARSVEDAALLFSVQAGPDPRDPNSRLTPGSTFAPPLAGTLDGIRVAWAGDLGLDWEPEAYDVPKSALQYFSAGGSTITEAAPNLTYAMEVFRVFRGLMYRDPGCAIPRDVWQSAETRRTVKKTLANNIQYGMDLTVDEVMDAELARTKLHLDVVEFFNHYDVLALPTTQVSPFPVEVEYPTEINGKPMDDYLSWMSSCCIITSTGCPSISMPCGTNANGMPLGIQLVAAPGNDRRLLEIAQAFEEAAPPPPRPAL